MFIPHIGLGLKLGLCIGKIRFLIYICTYASMLSYMHICM